MDTASTLGMLYAQYGRFKLTEAEDANIPEFDERFDLNHTGKLNMNMYKVVLILLSVQTQRAVGKRRQAKRP